MQSVVKLRQRLNDKPQHEPERKPRNWIKSLPNILRRAKAKLAQQDARSNVEGIRGNLYVAPQHPPGVGPEFKEGDYQEAHPIAMDAEIVEAWNWANTAQSAYGSAFAEGVTFLGYAYLSALAQRAEYRVVAETIAAEMTREWIELKSASDDKGKAEKLKELFEAQKGFNLQHRFYKVALDDGQFGRSHLYIDLNDDTDDRDELIKPIGDGRDSMSKAKFHRSETEEGEETAEEDIKTGERKGTLKAFRNVEAVWCYPTRYDSNDPLKAGWYRPRTWYVMGKELHVSRFLTFVGREVPDMLKPAYSFGGLSIYQMLKPYVDNWLRIRQSVSDLVFKFSTNVLATDMGAATMAVEGEDIFARVDFFNFLKDNGGTLLIDKNTEDYINVSTSLSGLDALQAQSQEHMAAIARIPLVKLLGISPEGLNASTEGEIRAFYDWIAAFQEHLFRKHLQTCLDFIQLDLWGEVDEDITFDFKSLWQLDEAGKSGVEKVKADIDNEYIAAGVVSPEEVRERIAHDKESQYASLELDPSKLPQQPGMMGGEGEPPEVGGGENPETQKGPLPGAPPGMEAPKPQQSRLPSNVTTKSAEVGGANQAWDIAVQQLTTLAMDEAISDLEREEVLDALDSLIKFKRHKPAIDEFLESDHPRGGNPENKGEFSSSGGGSGSSSSGSAKSSHLVAASPDKAKWPKHIQAMKLPPAWTDVKYSPDPKADLQAIGKDAKGRPQYVYSAKFRDSQSAAKFARIKKLANKFTTIVAKNDNNLKSKDQKKAEHAAVLSLILDMGLRPGSEKDTGAEKQAYGATTLRGDHVVTEAGETFLRFVGKKGVDLNLPVTNPDLASALQKRAASNEGQLFPAVTDSTLRNYAHSLSAGFKVKDFRTLKGTSVASDLVSKIEPPKNEKEFKAKVKEVATAVSQKLGNTPTIALQSYISPFVFAEWKQGLAA